MSDPDIYEVIDGLGSVSFTSLAYRHVSTGIDYRSGEGARRAGGRWNPPGSFPAIYAALTAESAAAEFYRLAARNARAPAELLPRTLHTMQVELESVLDLRPPRCLNATGLSVGLVQSDDLAPCQGVGEAAYKLGLEGLLAPSGTGIGETLVIFVLKLRVSSRVELVSSED